MKKYEIWKHSSTFSSTPKEVVKQEEVLARERLLRKLISPFPMHWCKDFCVLHSLQQQETCHDRVLFYRVGDVVQDCCHSPAGQDMPWEEQRAPRVQRAGWIPKRPCAEENGMGNMLVLAVWGRRGNWKQRGRRGWHRRRGWERHGDDASYQKWWSV